MKRMGAEQEAQFFFSDLKRQAASAGPEKIKEMVFNISKKYPSIESPLIHNSIKYLRYNLDSKETKAHFLLKINHILEHFSNTQEKIADEASSKIKDGFTIFTHSYSSTVMQILKKAKAKGKRFTVLNTETRPTLEGRNTSLELHKMGINNILYVDSAARLALKRSDLFLMGADSISKEYKAIGRVGSEMFAETASRLDVPIYCCIDSWKFNPNFKFDDKKQEIWQHSPVKVNNYSYEFVDPSIITGLVTELGILRPDTLKEEVKRKYPWLFLP